MADFAGPVGALSGAPAVALETPMAELLQAGSCTRKVADEMLDGRNAASVRHSAVVGSNLIACRCTRPMWRKSIARCSASLV